MLFRSEIEAFDEDTVTELRTRAKDALLTMEIAKEEKVEEVSQDLRDLEFQGQGLNTELIDKLATRSRRVAADYVGFTVEDLWVVGYGLDYADRHRTLPYIAELKPETYGRTA